MLVWVLLGLGFVYRGFFGVVVVVGWLVLFVWGFFFANAWKIIIITWKITGFPRAPAHPGHLAQDGNVPSHCLCWELFKP